MLFKLFDSFEKKKCLEMLGEYGLITQGNYWWVRYPKRAIEEILTMKENTNAYMSICDDQLIWTEKIVNNLGSEYLITIESRDNYPFKMPKVSLIEPWVNPNQKIHMYKNGTICFMHPDSYNSRISVLEIRNQVAVWCFAYDVFTHTGEWPAAEHNH
jgi:hypothetical protein